MTMTPRWPRALLLTLLLLSVSLAGCAGSDDAGPDDGDGAGDDGATSGEDGGADGSPTPPTPANEREAAAQRVAAELERLAAEPGHYLMALETTEGSRPGQRTTQTLFVDSANATTVYRLLTTGGATRGEDQLVGQVARTTFVGRFNTTVLAARNDTLAAFTTPEAFAQLVGSGRFPGALIVYYGLPQGALMQAGHLPSYTATSVEATTHEGKPAERITFGSASGTQSAFVVDAATDRILEVSVAQSMGGSVKWTNGTFAYGADARADLADALVRGEAMTFLDPAALRAAQIGSEPEKNATWTIRASEAGAQVALADVELRLYSQSGPESSEPRLVVAAADGDGESADARLSYDDADGDGLVSAGDTFTLATLRDRDDAHDFRVRLVDTTTGLSLGDR
jgi:hypothetical protein